jgi:hypothetical protein
MNIEWKTYKGFIILVDGDDWQESGDLVALSFDGKFGIEPLASLIKSDIEKFGEYLSVRYFISEKEMSEEGLLLDFLKRLYGLTECKYFSHYSESTGYLWTDEKLIIGGHDLISELESFEGKYCFLKIGFTEEPVLGELIFDQPGMIDIKKYLFPSL